MADVLPDAAASYGLPRKELSAIISNPVFQIMYAFRKNREFANPKDFQQLFRSLPPANSKADSFFEKHSEEEGYPELHEQTQAIQELLRVLLQDKTKTGALAQHIRTVYVGLDGILRHQLFDQYNDDIKVDNLIKAAIQVEDSQPQPRL